MTEPGSPEDPLERLSGGVASPVEDLLSRPLRPYWLARAAQHLRDSYAGVPLAKFPEDLRIYEHLLWAQRPNVVIELGTFMGASALWFRDRLRTLRSYGLIEEPRVISVDLHTAAARERIADVDPDWERDITLLEGDVCDGRLPGRVEGLLPPGARCLVIEDSAHTYETTRGALEGFARFVAEGGFLVVEDGCVDVEAMRLEEGWPRGVTPAVEDWLRSEPGSAFRMRRDLELYGVTCHPHGFLQRTGSG